MKTKAQKILDSARTVALSAETWADLSNALFDPEEGLVAKAYPTREEREKFTETEEYQAIRQLIDAAEERTGLIDGATPKKSGKFLVRLPQSLHAALDAEAEQEGVSLNQLVVTKLAVQMSRLMASPTPEMGLIAQSYLEVRNGFSIDRVIADPDLNRRYLRRCRELGLAGTDFDLNWKLLTGRKSGFLTDMPRPNYTAPRRDEFEFSSEMAIRYVQEQVYIREHRHISLDKILCDPDLAAEFDQIAAKIAPGFTPLDYRWVALVDRKRAWKHYGGKAQRIKFPDFHFLGPTNSVRVSGLPADPGMYFFRSEDQPLFIGETDNLRQRIGKHFDSSAQLGIPDWLYDSRAKTITLGIVPTPKVSPADRKIIELGAIQAFQPLFNYCSGRVA